MNNRQKRFFRLAREVSYLSDVPKARIGAVVVEKNRVLSKGYNSSKTSTVQSRYNRYRNFRDETVAIPKVHAEVSAIAPLMHRTDIDWSKVSIYVYRELKNGKRSCARPCEACAQLIRDLGIRYVYYTDWDGNYVKEECL